MLDWIVTLIVIAVAALATLTIAAIIDVALEYFNEANQVLIVDPKVSEELERIANEKSTGKEYVRYVYDRKSKKAVLVESNNLADELNNAETITVDIRN